MDALNKDLIISISSKNNLVVIYQIFSCVTAVLKTDKSAEVRRAAVLVITFLLRGLGKSIMEVNYFNVFYTLCCKRGILCVFPRDQKPKNAQNPTDTLVT